MKNLELLPVTDSAKTEIRLLHDKLRAYAGICVEILEITSEGVIKVRVEQKELKNGFILNQSELVSRAATVLSPLQNQFRIFFYALTYIPDLNEVDASWINAKMHDLKLSRNDLIKQLALDKSTLSILLNGERQLTRFQKAAFYYYFLSYEINRDIRDYLNE